MMKLRLILPKLSPVKIHYSRSVTFFFAHNCSGKDHVHSEAKVDVCISRIIVSAKAETNIPILIRAVELSFSYFHS